MTLPTDVLAAALPPALLESASETGHPTAYLVVLAGALVLLVGVVPLLLLLRRLHGRRQMGRATGCPAFRSPSSVERLMPVVRFAIPSRWLALRNTDPRAVQEALRLGNPHSCSWAEGLRQPHARQLFISPLVQNWTLVLGPGLPDPVQDVDACFHLVRRMSQKLGLVQFFCANRTVGDHGWVMAYRGEILRAYVWAGRTLWNQGQATTAEKEVGMILYEYGEEPTPPDPKKARSALANVEKVTLLAARWSLNPAAIDDRVFRQGQGIVGEFSHAKPC